MRGRKKEAELPSSTDSFALKRVLCATDFSDSAAAALEVAIALARPGKAEIRVIHVRPTPVPSGRPMACLAHRPGIDEKSRNDLMESLDRCGQPAIASGVVTQGVLLQGDAPDEIVREAKHTAADLIVMGRHSQGASNPWILGSVAERVLRIAPCPVVVVRPFPRRRGESPRHVLCGLDLAETAAATLEYAVAVTNVLEADLLVLHVVADGGAEGARSAVAGVVARASATRVRVHERVVTGVPYEEILAAARDSGTDLVAVGSHGGGIVDRQFLGSTTLHLLRESECPVLVVPAHVSQTREQSRSETLLSVLPQT
jgi:nucleotide-binding universal stress UspA family protein